MTRGPTEAASVLFTSVPPSDTELVEELLPGARVELDPLSPTLAAKHADARVLSVMIHDPVDARTLDAFQRLDGVVTRSDGYDHLPHAWLTEHGVPAFHLEGYATESVAQLALAFIIALTRRIPEAHAVTGAKDPRWDRAALVGRRLDELTVGVVGVGRIGSRVAGLLEGLGARVVGYDIDPAPANAATLDGLPGFSFAGGLDELLGASDVVTLHVPLTDATRHMIDADALERLGAGGFLINTARGDVVDQAAVERALDEGRLAGYATDVLPNEPEAPDLVRFATHDRALITPHLGAHNRATIRARYEQTAVIVAALVAGRPADVEAFRVI